MFNRRIPAAVTAALLVAGSAGTVAGCASTKAASSGASDGVPSSPGRTSYPFTLDNCGQKVTFTRPPQRVLILNGTSVAESESFVLLGLQGHVFANAQSYGVSDDPTMTAKVAALPKRGLTMNRNFEVPAEQALATKPDLVVSTWTGGFDPKRGLATREQFTAAGANTLVNPVNCALGKPNATLAEKKAYASVSVDSSRAFLLLLGRIFDVQYRAAQVVQDLRARVDVVRRTVAGGQPRKVLLAYPGMAMMNANGLPAVMTGRITDDVIRAAGGVNAFAGRDRDTTSTLNREQLASAQVDVLVVGVFTPKEDPAGEARKLFAAYPQWRASRTGTYTTVSDGAFLGPLNAWAVEKIAKAVHGAG
ncbi:ABC transporter substrate-binding protein [Actinomadura rupiterrae]|uniref:ABC transporter substrate-binding protein n=1 Tax=Actinomadura rupiterrae TaxID=559627 RepID=UPI0020A461F9|nr:ABC transporter substrate-binding protein [Actinomadura rupiterrae]MCP2342402.1 iron complex transport system substrate-binding protein [Actinomadura rupiterrae]